MNNAHTRRHFVFLQGLATPFWARLAESLRRAGHEVTKVHLSGADLAFWRGPALNFRGRDSEWPGFIRELLHGRDVTEIVLFGDCRPYHRIAIAQAQRSGISVHVFEEGYVRPSFITLEREGSNGYSRLPRDPETILARAADLPAPSASASLTSSFLNRATWDVVAQSIGLAAAPFYPHYRWHGPVHPFVEYAGWLLRFVRAPLRNRASRVTIERLFASNQPFFLVPLQLNSDYQIRVHSPFPSMLDVVETVLESFARSAPPDRLLVFKRHPLDPELVRYGPKLDALARRFGLLPRIRLVGAAHLPSLVQRSSGVVVVNSTVGMTAMQLGRPVKTLGHALYDIEGLTSPGPLDSFWTAPQDPDPVLFAAFLRLLMYETQIEGDLFSEAGIEIGVANAARRILSR